jgi:hypothetical protein
MVEDLFKVRSNAQALVQLVALVAAVEEDVMVLVVPEATLVVELLAAVVVLLISAQTKQTLVRRTAEPAKC